MLLELERELYKVENLLKTQDDLELCEDFANNYSIWDSSYVGDAIMEWADGQVGIYYSDIYKNVECLDNTDYMEEALENFDSSDGSISKLIQHAWCIYNLEMLHSNVDTILKNIVLNAIEEMINREEEYIPVNYINVIKDRIDSLWIYTNNINRFDELETYVNDFLWNSYNEWFESHLSFDTEIGTFDSLDELYNSCSDLENDEPYMIKINKLVDSTNGNTTDINKAVDIDEDSAEMSPDFVGADSEAIFNAFKYFKENFF
jgi:hypothetical protein